MKVAVIGSGPTLDACVGTQTGDSKYILIVDPDTMRYEAMANPVLAPSDPGAGGLFAQQLLQQDVSKVLAGNCSSNVLKSLGDVGIQIIEGMNGSVRNVLKQFKEMCMADTIVFFEDRMNY